jgi:hypothetical protein
MDVRNFLLCTIAATFISLSTAMAYTPSPDTQKILNIFVWVSDAEQQCHAFNGIHFNSDKMTKLFHSVGLRWGDLQRQIGEPIEGEPDDIVPNAELGQWLSALQNKVQDQLVFYSTEEERSHGATHDVKGFCDKMWKDFGPGSALQLLEK